MNKTTDQDVGAIKALSEKWAWPRSTRIGNAGVDLITDDFEMCDGTYK